MIHLATVLALAGCIVTGGGADDDGLTGSGGATGTLAGRVTIGPICPVETEGEPCPVPAETYASVTVVVDAVGGRNVARQPLDSEGRYRIELVPGRYLVTLEHGLGIDPGRPVEDVEIRAGGTVTLDFDIDTGIR